MLIGMGLLFIAVPLIIQLVPIEPENIQHYRNGVHQVSTQDSVKTLRMIFWLTFGLIGFVEIIVGGIIYLRKKSAKKNAERLKANGRRIYADYSGYEASNVYVNNSRLLRLVCSYTDTQGRTFIFKSGLLRMNVDHYLRNGKVNVYHDRNNMKDYFVDVDGSAGLGTTLFEL